jgi:MFS family permease
LNPKPTLSRTLFGLIAGQICLHASMAGIRMALPLQALRAGYTQAAVGPLIALFAAAPVALALPAGRLADRHGYHLPVRLAVLAACGGGACAALSTCWPGAQYAFACAAALLCGAGCNLGLLTILRSAGRSAHDANAQKRVFSWLGIAPSISNFLGPQSAGLMIDRLGFGAACCALALLPLASLAVSRLVPQEPIAPAADGGRRRPAWDLLAAPSLRRLLLVNWFLSTSWDVHSFVVPVLGHERQLSASAIGSVLGAFALAVTAVRLILPWLAHRVTEAQVLRAAMLCVAAVFLVYPFATRLWSMAACASALGFALGCSQPMIMTSLHQITPAARHGEAIALRSMAINGSSALMPLGFGAAGALLGAAGVFWGMAAIVGLGAWLSSPPAPEARCLSEAE